MKHLLSLILLLLLPTVQPSPGDTVSQADTAYMNGDFQTAVSRYESLLDGGFHHPAVYFNLASAYHQMGDLGRALLNYRRAQLFWPRDNDLNRQLAQIRLERTDLLGDENGIIESLAELSASVATLGELSLLVGLLWFSYFSLIVWYILRPAQRLKLRLLFPALSILLIAGLVILGSRSWVSAYRPGAVVVQDRVQVMSGPGEAYLPLYPLHAAAELRVWEVRQDWVQFALPDGRLGWLHRTAVEFIQPESVP